jgi:hypothetical protein
MTSDTRINEPAEDSRSRFMAPLCNGLPKCSAKLGAGRLLRCEGVRIIGGSQIIDQLAYGDLIRTWGRLISGDCS